MRQYLRYLQTRFIELPIWLPFPLLGVFSTVARPPVGRLVVFGLAVTAAVSHLLLVNDWGDLKCAPLEIERYQDIRDSAAFSRMLRNAALLTLVIGALGAFVLLPLGYAVGLGAFFALLSALYSHPIFHFKENPILSNLLHIMGGTLLFVLGVSVFSGDMAEGLSIGLFFGLVLMGGHCFHEGIDRDEDIRYHTRTSATRWGVSRTVSLGIWTFFVAHAHLVVLAYLGVTTWSVAAIFSLPAAVHVFSYRSVAGAARRVTRTGLLGYRRRYRVAFAASSVVFVVGRLLSSW